MSVINFCSFVLVIVGPPGEKGTKGDKGLAGKLLFDSITYSDDAKHFKCYVSLLCINVNAHHVLFLGRDKGNEFLAFHPGIQGLTGQKGSKGDYGSPGPKGNPGVKGDKGDRGSSGKAVCHGVYGADSAFGFGTLRHRLARAALGRVYRAHLEELNRQISLPRRWMCGVSHSHLGRCAKRQVKRCVRLSHIPDLTENWKNLVSSLFCTETSCSKPHRWGKSHVKVAVRNAELETTGLLNYVSPVVGHKNSSEGEGNMCFVKVASGTRARRVFFNHLCSQDQDAAQKDRGWLGMSFCCPMAARRKQTPWCRSSYHYFGRYRVCFWRT